jgi:hypothetical protein
MMNKDGRELNMVLRSNVKMLICPKIRVEYEMKAPISIGTRMSTLS